MVTVFSKPNCPQCAMTKKFLKAQGTDFNEIDVTQNQNALQRLISEGKRSLPVVETDDAFWMGFRPDSLRTLA